MLFSQFLPECGAADRRTFIVPLSDPERAFLLEAVAYYCATRCPLEWGEGSCPMLSWRESAHHLGAIEKVCSMPPRGLPARLSPDMPSIDL